MDICVAIFSWLVTRYSSFIPRISTSGTSINWQKLNRSTIMLHVDWWYNQTTLMYDEKTLTNPHIKHNHSNTFARIQSGRYKTQRKTQNKIYIIKSTSLLTMRINSTLYYTLCMPLSSLWAWFTFFMVSLSIMIATCII
jgi:hypothetical protein